MCGVNNSREECAHLVFHGSDLSTCAVIELCGCPLNPAQRRRLKLPERADDFFERFSIELPSFAESADAAWAEGASGLGGVYSHIWQTEAGSLREDICRFILNRKAALLARQRVGRKARRLRKRKRR